MISHRRIHKVYVKELVDILRDRRTLTAMVVVPIVLYPLLMLGSAQALSSSAKELTRRTIIIGVASPEDHVQMSRLIAKDDRFVEAFQPAKRMDESATESATESPPDADGTDVTDGAEDDSPQPVFIDDLYMTRALYEGNELDTSQLEDVIRDRRVHLCVVITPVPGFELFTERWDVKLFFDPEEVRSGHAAGQIRELLETAARREVEKRIKLFGVPVQALEPVRIEERHITTPGSILGQILPVILVLMTITGAIYPAIDLTAGERERGTLETLMVCPVPVFELIVGKFLVVTTVAIVGAALNLASISATVYLGGFHTALGVQTGSEGFPFGVLPVILLLLVPFAILFSAIMIAVCSYARTFKEAQNYVTPVILAALVPGGVAALPTSELQGVFLVMPVANMVLLTRELLLGSPVAWSAIAWVVVSTTLYAVSAVAIAARIYGSESVVFADSGSLKAVFSRRMIRPSLHPSPAMAILAMAVLFPVWFFVQVRVQTSAAGSVVRMLRVSAAVMPVCFVLIPLLLMGHWKVNIARTLRLGVPLSRHLLAGLLIGVAAWVPSAELSILQARLVGFSEAFQTANETMIAALQTMHPLEMFLCLGLIPGLCEELAFRGFLLSGLGSAFRKWTAIIATACAFAVFHFYFFKFPVTAALGVALGYLCWQSRSIWPGVLAHAAHNTVSALIGSMPTLASRLGVDLDNPWAHLPGHVILLGVVLVAAGLMLASRQRES